MSAKRSQQHQAGPFQHPAPVCTCVPRPSQPYRNRTLPPRCAALSNRNAKTDRAGADFAPPDVPSLPVTARHAPSDLWELHTGPCLWRGEPPFPTIHVWTRLLLFQQLLIDVMDLLDPDYVRVLAGRRVKLFPVAYDPLPKVCAHATGIRTARRRLQLFPC